MITLKEFARALKNADNIVLYPHVGADGDSLGSSAALCCALRSLGKECVIYYNQEIADNLDFIGSEYVVTESSEIKKNDFSIMIDCEGRDRIGDVRFNSFEKASILGCIDHHISPKSDIPYDYYYCEPDSAATAEVVYLLIKELGCDITLDIAKYIWTGITTDTGNFQHANTTGRTHRIVTELYDVQDFKSKPISVLLYDRKKKGLIRLESEVLLNLDFYFDGIIGIGVVSEEQRESHGVKPQDINFLINRIASINGVEISILIKEESDKIKASLRSNSSFNVASICESFGGGGHIAAAGCSFDSKQYTTKEVGQLIIDAIAEVI